MFEFNGMQCELIRNFKSKNEINELLEKPTRSVATEVNGWNYDSFYKKAKAEKEYGDIYRCDGIVCIPCRGVLLGVDL